MKPPMCLLAKRPAAQRLQSRSVPPLALDARAAAAPTAPFGCAAPAWALCDTDARRSPLGLPIEWSMLLIDAPPRRARPPDGVVRCGGARAHGRAGRVLSRTDSAMRALRRRGNVGGARPCCRPHSAPWVCVLASAASAAQVSPAAQIAAATCQLPSKAGPVGGAPARGAAPPAAPGRAAVWRSSERRTARQASPQRVA